MELLTILGLASFGVTLQKTEWYKNTWLNRKPFNCTLCLTTWGSFIYLCFFPHGMNFENLIFTATAAGVLAEYIDQKTNAFN